VKFLTPEEQSIHSQIDFEMSAAGVKIQLKQNAICRCVLYIFGFCRIVMYLPLRRLPVGMDKIQIRNNAKYRETSVVFNQ
jgi:hypothetical protein